jgi:hypothetical protein
LWRTQADFLTAAEGKFIRTSNRTLQQYSQAFRNHARRAQGKIVEMVRQAPLPPRPEASKAEASA